MSQLGVDLRGRVKNLPLPPSRPLLPVFEAVTNAIQAIRETRTKSGHVRVEIRRDESQDSLELGEDTPTAKILGFSISDNGVGFTLENFNAFCTSDTTRKLSIGGKGVGRLSWLKAFESVEVKSLFKDGKVAKQRAFGFDLDKGVHSEDLDNSPSEETGTTVELQGFRQPFKDRCPLMVSTIAERFLAHFLVFLLSADCPRITVTDGEVTVDINRLFVETRLRDIKSQTLKIKDQQFVLHHVQLSKSDESKHRVHLCATQREVKSILCSSIVPEMNGLLFEENDRPFFYVGYLTGDYLDNNVNAERTEFTFPIETDLEFPDLVTEEDIRLNLADAIESEFGASLERLRTENFGYASNYIAQSSPQYRGLLTHRRDAIERIPAGLPVPKMELELRKIDYDFESELVADGRNYLSANISSIYEDPSKQQEFQEFIRKVSDLSKDKLAHYVIHRRVVLEILRNGMGVDADGRIAFEGAIHDLIFPRGKTSENVSYQDHNLWVLDERLSYHSFLSSDRRLDRLPAAVLTVSSARRPDILIFNNAMAYAEGGVPYQSVVVVEFKRPEREDYDVSENPFTQVKRYIELLRQGTKKDPRMRTINLGQNTPFFCYIVSDLTPAMKQFIGDEDLTPTPDGLGFLGSKTLTTHTLKFGPTIKWFKTPLSGTESCLIA